jgi:tRNA(Ile)-lysidine synthase
VPSWERERLPVVYRGRDVLFAAGIGMDCRHFSEAGESLVALRWEASSA